MHHASVGYLSRQILRAFRIPLRLPYLLLLYHVQHGIHFTQSSSCLVFTHTPSVIPLTTSLQAFSSSRDHRAFPQFALVSCKLILFETEDPTKFKNMAEVFRDATPVMVHLSLVEKAVDVL